MNLASRLGELGPIPGLDLVGGSSGSLAASGPEGRTRVYVGTLVVSALTTERMNVSLGFLTYVKKELGLGDLPPRSRTEAT